MAIYKRRLMKSWKIPSRSAKGETHIVSLRTDGEWLCDCLGWAYSKNDNCRHVRQAKNLIHGDTYRQTN